MIARWESVWAGLRWRLWRVLCPLTGHRYSGAMIDPYIPAIGIVCTRCQHVIVDRDMDRCWAEARKRNVPIWERR